MGECAPCPPQYRGKKSTCGLAGAAIVSLNKKQEYAKLSNSTRSSILTSLDASLTGKLTPEDGLLVFLDVLLTSAHRNL